MRGGKHEFAPLGCMSDHERSFRDGKGVNIDIDRAVDKCKCNCPRPIHIFGCEIDFPMSLDHFELYWDARAGGTLVNGSSGKNDLVTTPLRGECMQRAPAAQRACSLNCDMSRLEDQSACAKLDLRHAHLKARM